MNSDELRKLYDEGRLTPEQFLAKLFGTEEADRVRRSIVEKVEFERDKYMERYVWLLEYIGTEKALEIIRERKKAKGAVK